MTASAIASPAPGMDWGALVLALQKAGADLKANKPFDPTAVSNFDIGSALQSALPYVDDAAAAIKAHPGLMWALEDVLDALKTQGYAWASELEAALNAVPGALAAWQEWAPTVIGMLHAFAPAAIGIPGEGSANFKDR